METIITKLCSQVKLPSLDQDSTTQADGSSATQYFAMHMIELAFLASLAGG